MRFVQMRQLGLGQSVAPDSVDLIVFPENAVLRYIEGSEYLAEFRDLSRSKGKPLLVGVTARPKRLPELATADEGYAHNSAALITGDGIVARYDKLHLIPFSEQVPAERLFAALGQLGAYRRFIVSRLGYMGRAVPGDRVHLLRIPGFEDAPMWTPVCFEQADARLAREAARQGTRFFVNITSEGDLGPQIFRNTEAIAVLRAIEMRVGVARCGNVGITAMIDPWGRRTHVLRGKTGALWGEPGVLTARVPLGSGRPTLYARFGDWPAGASALVLLASLGIAILRSRGA
jgi:apolipoprotein N-acyltransferase